jgi:hypothetical protein
MRYLLMPFLLSLAMKRGMRGGASHPFGNAFGMFAGPAMARGGLRSSLLMGALQQVDWARLRHAADAARQAWRNYPRNP